ncbi:MAG: holin family protein [Roseovarius sp.]
MGLIDTVLNLVFGNGRNAIAETAHIWRENTEAGAAREAELTGQVLAQYGKEFSLENRGMFDRIMDGVNRLPRPAMALGTLALFVSAMINPTWFAERMQGIALVPEPLWWLLGAIVSFYFGARHQIKGQQFQQSLATTMALAPQVAGNIAKLRGVNTPVDIRAETPGVADTQTDARITEATVQSAATGNAALDDWNESRAR